jgi:hypothetical protein
VWLTPPRKRMPQMRHTTKLASYNKHQLELAMPMFATRRPEPKSREVPLALSKNAARKYMP